MSYKLKASKEVTRQKPAYLLRANVQGKYETFIIKLTVMLPRWSLLQHFFEVVIFRPWFLVKIVFNWQAFQWNLYSNESFNENMCAQW